MTSLQTFDYEGHCVTISSEPNGRGLRYWFSVDGRPITFVSHPDTAKRLATRFIDVVNDAYYGDSRQQPVYKSGLC